MKFIRLIKMVIFVIKMAILVLFCPIFHVFTKTFRFCMGRVWGVYGAKIRTKKKTTLDDVVFFFLHLLFDRFDVFIKVVGAFGNSDLAQSIVIMPRSASL